MLAGALSSSLLTGWWSILLIRWTFIIWVRHPGRCIADKGGGKSYLSDSSNAATPIILEEWPGCFDHLFRIRNVSFSSHLLDLSAWFLLCSGYIVAALPHLQKVANLGHSVQFFFLSHSLYFRVIFCVHCIQHSIIACQYAIIGSTKLPSNDFLQRVSPVVLTASSP